MDDQQEAGGEQPRMPKDFRRRAHSFRAEGARPTPSKLKLNTPNVKGQNLGEGRRDLPLVGIPVAPAPTKATVIAVKASRAENVTRASLVCA